MIGLVLEKRTKMKEKALEKWTKTKEKMLEKRTKMLIFML